MSEFDDAQTKLLIPLIENEVILHFSFYANTFPIAYHYNLLLDGHYKAHDKREDIIAKFIMPHGWSEVFPSRSNWGLYGMRKAVGDTSGWKYPESINLFYASDILFQTAEFVKDNPYKIISEAIPISDAIEKIEQFSFSKYIPRFVFLNNNLFTQKLTSPNKKEYYTIDSTEFKEIDRIKEQFYSLTEILSRAKEDGIENLCVYTETINEAKDIFETYDDWKNKINYYDERKINSLKLDDRSKNESKSLDIFFYGAPTSFLFLNRRNRFLPVLLDKANLAIETKAILHFNSEKPAHAPDRINIIKASLQLYHNNLFNAAKSSNGNELLNNVRLAYNRYARLKRSDSYFFTPQSFANCIALHNEYNEEVAPKDTAKVALPLVESASNQKNVHIHYGAGKLAIGLVLPMIKPTDVATTTQLIVLQKNRDDSEWNKKIDFESEEIILSNNLGWRLNLKLYNSHTKPGFSPEGNDCFILFRNYSEIVDLLKSATSISYSLNDKEIEKDFLKHLSDVAYTKEVLLFPFENKPFGSAKEDLKDFEAVMDKLTKSNIKYVKVKADRICSHRTFRIKNEVNVLCEPHVELVLKVDKQSTNSLFPLEAAKNQPIIFAETSEKFEFLSRRKAYLVNELHFILVVYGYNFLISKGIDHWENQYVSIIQSALTSDANYTIPVETFIRLQIMRLLFPEKSEDSKKPYYTLSTVMAEYGIKEQNLELLFEYLLRYARYTTQRFNTSKEDQISRVFNTNDANAIDSKYKDIIGKIEKYILDDDNKNIIETVQMLSGGTYLEYKYLIKDIQSKIGNLLSAKKKHFERQVQLKEDEHKEKGYELLRFEKKVNSLIQATSESKKE